MTFQDSTLEGVYGEIRRRQADFGRLSLVEFDDEEYKVLLSLGQEIVRRYEYWWWDKHQKARVVFLAFACEYVRRNKYMPDNIFWDEFEATLGIGWMERRALIADELLWQTYNEEGIERQWGNVNRLIVRSLISEVWDAPKAARRQFVAFFRWYYQNCAGFEVTSELIQEYETETGNLLNVIEKAASTLDRDCQALARVIEYAVEHSLSLARSDLVTYRQEIVETLGTECDPARLRLLRDERTLRNLIIELENHYTPVQFLRELEHHPAAMVQTPGGRRLPAHMAHQRWRAADLDYGPYRLDEIEYRVVPLPWLRLESIDRWPYKEIVSLRRKGYLGYKKQQPFEVKAGERIIAGRRCISQKGEVIYIWAGAVPQGERFVVDGHPCRESAGLDWEATLCLGYNEDGELIIAIALNKLVAYFPDRGGDRLIISTSQGYEQVEYLRIDGSRRFHRAIAIPLEEFAEPVTVSVRLGEELLDSKVFTPESAYLFSSQTQEFIRAGTARERGERQYYLFTYLGEYPLADKSVRVEPLDAVFGAYEIYKVIWEDLSQYFSLTIGDLSWSIQQQGYFHIQIEPQPTAGIVRLTRNQAYRFSQAPIRVLTNLDLATAPVVCQIFFSGELVAESKASECLQLYNGNETYLFTEDFLNKLDAATNDRYGQYDLLFSEDGQLLDQTTLALVPELNVRLPDSERLLLEDAMIEVNVFSPHLAVWDPATGQTNLSATLQLRPKLSAQSWMAERSAKGVMHLTPQTITVPLVFPSISEIVEISVRPRLFGFRLYQRGYETGRDGQPHARYWQVDELDYYTLETAALYIFAEANSEVTLCVGETEVWSGQADSEGHLLIQELDFLKPHCQEERVSIKIASAGLECDFFIRWTPLIHKMMIKEGRIHLCISGPRNTGIVLRFVELDEVIRIQQWVACTGENLEVSLKLPAIEASSRSCYLVPLYHLTDGTLLPAAQQWRIIVAEDTAVIPTDWLRAGIGVSSEAILQMTSQDERWI